MTEAGEGKQMKVRRPLFALVAAFAVSLPSIAVSAAMHCALTGAKVGPPGAASPVAERAFSDGDATKEGGTDV
jgi:hypothetical protein